MAWQTSLILIRSAASDVAAEIIEALQLGTPLQSNVSFEDATSGHALGVGIGSVDGWTIVTDPALFAEYHSEKDSFFGLTTDTALRRLSTVHDPIWGLILCGGISTYGLAVFSEGQMQRAKRIEGDRTTLNLKPPSQAELKWLPPRAKLNEDSLLDFLSALCSHEQLDLAKFTVYERPVSAFDELRTVERLPATVENIPAFMKLLDDPDPLVVIAASAKLKEMHRHSAIAIPPLIKLLTHDDVNVRGRVTEVLGEFGKLATSAIPSLEKLLRSRALFRHCGDRKEPIRFAAAFTIVSIDPLHETALLVVLEAMAQQKPALSQAQAALLLRDLKPPPMCLLPRLRELEQDVHPGVRCFAQVVLSSLVADYIVTSDLAINVLKQLRWVAENYPRPAD